MEKNESLCMDDENDRLVLCQAVSDRVYKDFKSVFEDLPWTEEDPPLG